MGFEDWRWKLLCGLALLLLAVSAMPAGDGLIVSPAGRGETPAAWSDMDLSWRSEGLRGQGIYSPEVTGSRSVADLEEAGAEEGLVEPRLAVLTYRPMDLNRVDFDTLRALKGVGPKMAAAIVAYRRSHGPFRRIEELREVKGVGPAKFKLLSRSLAVKSPADP